ncbi:MAG: InlB B-repeat-containing protein, partial [Clostridia bacterium]|nr:InlB B-repeat-containing protein [Clostridia bacterium]
MNCHANGIMRIGTSVGNLNPKIGGIVGNMGGGSGGTFTMYRCSSDMKATISCNNASYEFGIGAMIGQASGIFDIEILDCYGNATANFPSASNKGIYAGIIGTWYIHTGNLRVENYAGSITINNLTNIIGDKQIGTLSGMVETTASGTYYAANTVKYSNIYVNGDVYSGSTPYTMYPIVVNSNNNTNYGRYTLSVTNNNYAGTNIGSMFTSMPAGYTANNRINSLSTKAASTSSLWNDAQTFFSANKVWNNYNQIGAATYSVDNSPVINKLQQDQFDIEFLNYKGTLDEPTDATAMKYNYGATGIKLSVPTADSNHEFVGWTTDKSGESTPFTTMPDNAYGNIKLYAVWDNPNATASISLYNSKTENDTDTLEYGTGNIKLTATSSGLGMPNPLKTFKWYKGNGNTAVESGDTCTLTDVNQSGDYYLEYTLQDTIEPLWRHKEKLTTPQSVTINKGQLSIKTFELHSDTPAYVRITLGKVDFTVEVKDNGDNVVEYKTAVWQAPNSKVADGTNDTFNIIVTPDDTDNYATATLTVSFESEYLKLTFDLDAGIAGEKLEVNLEYGEPYSANKIVNMFLTEFRKIIDDETNPLQPIYKDVENMAPYLDGVEISQYNTNLTDVTTPQKIEVMFIDKNYTITLKLDNGSADITQMRKFNQRLLPVSNPTKDEHVFKGWKYDDVDDNGNPTTKYWDIDEDRVKGDMTLTADWFKAKLTLVDIEVTPKAGGYEALTVMQDGDLEVIAHYTTDSPEYPTYDQKIRLDDAGGYKIIYSSSDGKLHVNNPGITVTYSYDGVTRTKPLTLTVNPKSLDEEMIAGGVTFENKTVVFDGTAKEIGEVKGELPIQISEVQYEYWFGGSVVDKSQVVNIGLYTVRAKFISSDPDYKASDMEATLTISRTGSGSDDETLPSGNPDSGNNGGGGSIDDILDKLKEIPLWQLIASFISIILIIIFLSKTAGYESKRKKYKKKTDKLDTTVYAGAFLGLAITGWTAIACVLMGLAVVSFVIMLIAKSRFNKAEENYEDSLEEYQRNKTDFEEHRRAEDNARRDEEYRRRDEDMQMMFMRMFGGGTGGNMNGGGTQPQGGFAYVQPGISADEMRGLISETVTALLPGVQQLLPQQASTNDEIIKSLIEEQKAMREVMQKLVDQPAERVVEKEVVATTANDEAIKTLIEGQKVIMEKLANQSNEPQIVEKVVEVPVEVEKIVEKEVVKEVPVEVEKIVEKEVRVE